MPTSPEKSPGRAAGPTRRAPPTAPWRLEGQAALLLESGCLTGSAGFGGGQLREGHALRAGFGAQLFLILTLATCQPTG